MSTIIPAEEQTLMRQWRQAFHRHPEVGANTPNTAQKIAQHLRSFGCCVHEGIGGCGVVGVLRCGNSPRTLAIRADMDALPIHECGTPSYASNHSGAMHACGHDGHSAMLLGAASTLAKNPHFDGTVFFIFQPDEENGTGALAMLNDGLFKRFPADAVYALHNLPGMPIGHFATRAGPITASESLFEIHIKARGGHAALPHLGVDALTVGHAVFQALQTIVARKLNPALNGVVSVTEFISDGTRNVLPGTATLKGDARALTPETRALIEKHMRQLSAGIAAAHEVDVSVKFDTQFEATINDANAARAATAAAQDSGALYVDGDCSPMLFSEDFAHMATAVPGCYLLMGNGVEGANARPLHANDYDFNDHALDYGAALWVQLVRNQLSQHIS